MRRAISILIVLSMLAAMSFSGFTSSAQNPGNGQGGNSGQGPSAPPKGYDHPLPPNAVIGSTAERKEAWNNATPAQREKARAKFSDILDKATKKLDKQKTYENEEPVPISIPVKDRNGNTSMYPALKSRKAADPIKYVKSEASKSVISQLTPKITRPPSNELVKGNHARRSSVKMASAAFAPQATCFRAPEQFVRNLYQGALRRPPYVTELPQSMNSLEQAQSQGNVLVTLQNLGSTLFNSQEGANLPRSNRDFVSDLYLGFLQRQPEQDGWDFWTGILDAGNSRPSVVTAFAIIDEFQNDVNAICDVATFDGDQDQLPDDFENRVADAFTPVYHVSTGEVDHFATFGDFLNDPLQQTAPQTVHQRFSPYGPGPISNFRVVKGGFAYFSSNPTQLVSILRIDYLTQWDHDSGLVGGGGCDFFDLGGFVQGLSAHDLDNERSVWLVAAPVADPNHPTHSFDPGAYSTRWVYTAGHEFKPLVEQVSYIEFPTPAPAYTQIPLYLAKWKHSTYPFNPDNHPIFPSWLIDEVYQEIDTICNCNCDPEGPCDDRQHLAECLNLLRQADLFFFGCVVERFGDSGERYAGIRINVGEPNAPINSSHFIQTSEINQQLTTPFFR